jgi:hypothetical protein
VDVFVRSVFGMGNELIVCLFAMFRGVRRIRRCNHSRHTQPTPPREFDMVRLSWWDDAYQRWMDVWTCCPC